jgi:DNA replication protein DnaC
MPLLLARKSRQPLSDPQKQDFLEAIEERYGSGALTITSQLPVTDWHEYLGGGRVADAILDRIVHASHRIEISSKLHAKTAT